MRTPKILEKDFATRESMKESEKMKMKVKNLKNEIVSNLHLDMKHFAFAKFEKEFYTFKEKCEKLLKMSYLNCTK